MLKKSNKITLLSLGLIVFSAICLVLRTVAVLTAFDSYIGYFDKSSAIFYFDRSFCAVSIIFGIIVSFSFSKDELPVGSPRNLFSTLAALLLAFTFAVSALLLFILMIPAESVLVHVAIIGAALSAVYYIYEGFRPIVVLGLPRSLASLIPIVTLLSIVFVENFDFNVALNSPDKQLVMFIFVLTPLYIIQRLKFAASSPSQKLYAVSTYATVFLGLYFSIPGIIGYFARVTASSKYLVYYLLALAIAIYAAVDLCVRIKLSSFEEITSTEDDTTEN